MGKSSVTASGRSARRPRVSTQLCLTGFVIIALTGCGDDASSVPPPRTGTTADLPEQVSTISVPFSIDLEALRDRLDAEFPRRLAEIDERKENCVPPRYAKVCVVPRLFRRGCAKWVKTKVSPGIDCEIEGKVDRGRLEIGGSGNVLEVSLPVKASVTVRGRGGIGKHIQETASGAIDATARIAMEITKDWQPTAKVEADFHWTERAHVDVLGFRITFGSKVKPEIRKALDRIERDLPRYLQELKLREHAEKAWKEAFTSAQIGKKPDVWLRFAPRQIGLSRLRIGDGALQIDLTASGLTQTFIGSRPENLPPTDLPPLEEDLQPAGFNFFLPVFADYATLEHLLEHSLGLDEKRTYSTPEVGDVGATFRDVTIYQTTDNAIAVGLTIDADPPGQLFDAKGTIWLTAKPRIDDDAKKIAPVSLDYGARTDNEATNLLVTIASIDPIRTKIEQALTYDFSKDLEKALVEANAALNQPLGRDFLMEGEIETAGVDDLVPTPLGLYLSLDVQGRISVRSRNASTPEMHAAHGDARRVRWGTAASN